eukprot:sb/3466135/
MTVHVFLLKLVNSGIFRGFIMSCILINTLTTAFYASYSKEASRYITEMEIIEMMDSLFLAIYTMEFVLKFSVKPRAFFFNGFNCFDFVVLILSYSQIILVHTGSANLGVFKVLRSVRALRPLRSVSFVGGLQVIVSALLTVLRSTFLHVMMLLLVIGFVFVIMGYYLFSEAAEEWNTFAKCALNLCVLVTAEGWPDIERGFYTGAIPVLSLSRFYIVIFLFIGHFVFSNLFVAVIIGQIDKATKDYERKKIMKYKTDLDKRKAREEEKHSNDISELLNVVRGGMKPGKFRQALLRSYHLLRSDEFTVHSDTVHSLIWCTAMAHEYIRLVPRLKSNLILHREHSPRWRRHCQKS